MNPIVVTLASQLSVMSTPSWRKMYGFSKEEVLSSLQGTVQAARVFAKDDVIAEAVNAVPVKAHDAPVAKVVEEHLELGEFVF